jgi:hypothetical protein
MFRNDVIVFSASSGEVTLHMSPTVLIHPVFGVSSLIASRSYCCCLSLSLAVCSVALYCH